MQKTPYKNPKIILAQIWRTLKRKISATCCFYNSLRWLLRRERDSNPRYLSVRRFSRPVQSTTLPSLLTCYASHGRHIAVLNIRTMPYCFCGCKGRAFCWFLQIFPQLFCSKDEKRWIKAPKGGFWGCHAGMGSAEWWVGHAGCLYQKHDARWSPIGNDDSQKAPRSFPFEQKRPCHSAKPHKSKGTLWDRCATHQSTTTTVVLALPDMFQLLPTTEGTTTTTAVHALPDCFILTTSH